MYYGRRKGIIIAIVICIIIAILAIGGVFLVFATDILKPADELFYKYMGQAIENFDYTENTQIENVLKLTKQMPYTVDGELAINVESEDINQYYGSLNQSKIKISAKVDENEDKANVRADLILNTNSILTLDYAKNDNLYGLKSDEIANAYIGIRNDNLNVFAQKIASDINSSHFPNELEIEQYGDIFTITDQEKQHIMETYIKVIRDNIDVKSFSKENNIAIQKNGVTYNTTGYRLNLTSTQIKNLETAILQTLTQDSITLNIIATKAKILGLGEEYTEINQLTQTINKKITEIQNSDILSNGMSIVVYVSDKQVISTEILLNNNYKFTINTTKNNNTVVRDILIDNLGASEEFSKIKISESDNKTLTYSSYDVTVDVDETVYALSVRNEGGSQEEYLNTDIEASISNEDKIYSLTYSQKMKFVDELENMITIDRTNCAILNDYSTEQLQELISNLESRISYLIEEKTSMLGVNVEGGNVEPKINEVMTMQEAEKFNAKYESYTGTITGTSLKTLLDLVNNSKNSKNRSVILILDGINTSGNSNVKVENNKNYKVEMVKDDDGFIKEIDVTTEI